MYVLVNVYRRARADEQNTDGWDLYRSSNIIVQNSRVNNNDGK